MSTSRRTQPLPPGWPKLRARILKRDGHRCQINGPRCIGTATEVDHIHGPTSEDPTNLQAACHPCHATKTGREARATQPNRRRTPEPHPGTTGGGTPRDP